MTPQRIGGSFAPPLTDELLDQYEDLAENTENKPVAEALQLLCECCREWWDLPDSEGLEGKREHPSGIGTIVPLDPPIKKALDKYIPWEHELAAMQGLFDNIPVEQKELRDAAFHLLWHVKELNLDREPITSDLVAGQVEAKRKITKESKKK